MGFAKEFALPWSRTEKSAAPLIDRAAKGEDWANVARREFTRLGVNGSPLQLPGSSMHMLQRDKMLHRPSDPLLTGIP